MPNSQFVQFGAAIPFPGPVSAPDTGIFDAPALSISVNEDWIPLLVGAMKVLLRDATWDVTNPSDLSDITAQVDDMLSSWETPAVSDLMPIGTILMFGGDSAPDTYLICNGSAVSRTTYADLFGVIGDTFGNGDGSTTFNLPDFREIFPMGVHTENVVNLGDNGGAASVKISVGQLPAHHHREQLNSNTAQTPASYASGAGSASYNYANQTLQTSKTIHDLDTLDTGGDEATPTVPPYLAVYFIIKAL